MMRFRVTHVTDYRYTSPVAEAHLELRLTPPQRETQRIESHQISLQPNARASSYHDFFGNKTDVVSVPYRHSRLTIKSETTLRTLPSTLPLASLELSIQEARQILASTLPATYDYLQPTDMVTIGREATQWAKRYLGSTVPLGAGLEALNRAIYTQFRYRSGSTDFSTDLAKVWKQRTGVCQDFAHLMLSVVRTAGLPARYVCGYIETTPPSEAAEGKVRLVGSVATHAWAEVWVPGQAWVALDPTNDRWCGEQHIAVSFGRDAREASPIRGTFKSSGRQVLKVRVNVRRLLK
ncbi:MAG: transglutaminase family protein [Verrucomicrobia bacterium]|nr:transglutaminase family protein [Verrucomicrobiota bacterium]